MTILQRKRPNAWDCINVWQAFFCRSCLFQRRTHTPQSDDDETEFARQCQKVQLLVCGRGKNLIISCEFDHPWFSSETKFFGPFWTVNACAKHCGLISWKHDMDMGAWHTWTNNMPTVACSRYIHVAGTLKQRGFGISWSHDSKRSLVSLQCHDLDILRDGLLLKKRLRQTEVFWELAAPLPYQCFRFLVLHVGNALPVFGSILGSAHECCSEGSPFLAFDIWVKELSAPNLDNTLIQGMQDYFTILVCNPPRVGFAQWRVVSRVWTLIGIQRQEMSHRASSKGASLDVHRGSSGYHGLDP